MADMTGMVFGKWTVGKKDYKKPNGRSDLWHCVCQCGKTKLIQKSALIAGQTKQCMDCRLMELAKDKKSLSWIGTE